MVLRKTKCTSANNSKSKSTSEVCDAVKCDCKIIVNSKRIPQSQKLNGDKHGSQVQKWSNRSVFFDEYNDRHYVTADMVDIRRTCLGCSNTPVVFS